MSLLGLKPKKFVILGRLDCLCSSTISLSCSVGSTTSLPAPYLVAAFSVSDVVSSGLACVVIGLVIGLVVIALPFLARLIV